MLTWIGRNPDLAAVVVVVVYSAICKGELGERALELGARECIAKGMACDALYDRVRDYLA